MEDPTLFVMANDINVKLKTFSIWAPALVSVNPVVQKKVIQLIVSADSAISEATQTALWSQATNIGHTIKKPDSEHLKYYALLIFAKTFMDLKTR